MADDVAKEDEPEVSRLRGKARDMAMFKDWFLGVSGNEIAARYGISPNMVSKVKERDKWVAKARDIYEMQFQKLGEKMKVMTIKGLDVLNRDLDRIIRKFNATGETQLSAVDREHIKQMIEFSNKTARLDEGKPTDISQNTGVVEHRILLPHGMKRWGVIPPADNVKFVEGPPTSEEADKKEEPKEEMDFDNE